MECEICKRVKSNKRVKIFEDENVVAYLSDKQIALGKTSVYYKKHVTRFTDLSESERNALMKSVIKVGELLEKGLEPDHMNYCLLGNYYPHLHWHLIPRYEDASKDHFYNKDTGLEPCHMGREVHHLKVSKARLEEIKEVILQK